MRDYYMESIMVKKRARRPGRPLSRRGLRVMWAAAILLAAYLAACPRLAPKTAPAGGEKLSGQEQSERDRQRYDKQEFLVVKVVDGDTLDVAAADGEKDYTRVRLWGVDTPETKHPQRGVMYYGPEASEFARDLAEGQKVRICLEPFEKTRDKYGRLLGYVYLADGRMLNVTIVICAIIVIMQAEY